MSNQVENSFIRQYEAEVHEAFQRQGTMLRGTVRWKGNVKGKSTTFQKVGKGTATQKARHAIIPPMSIDHTPVECTLADWYAGDFIDKLDELKTNIDERQVVANAGAWALGRKVDELIVAAADTTALAVGDYSTGLTKALVLGALELLNNQDVPDDGQRFGVVGTHQWNELLNLKEFASADWVGADGLPWKQGAAKGKDWLGVKWMKFTGLPLASGDDRTCLLYHKTALGVGSGQEVKSDITWEGTRAAHWALNNMSLGAVLIDGTGVVEIRVDDDAAIS